MYRRCDGGRIAHDVSLPRGNRSLRGAQAGVRVREPSAFELALRLDHLGVIYNPIGVFIDT